MLKKYKYLIQVPTVLICLAMIPVSTCLADDAKKRAFLEKLFQGPVSQPETLWITSSVRAVTESIPGHGLRGPRIKYWRENDRTVWILSDMAKDTPVCAAIVVSKAKIEKLEILSAEGRWGALVKNENFTAQFKGAAADADNRLDQAIDGITGATMSVEAVSGLARLALALDGIINTEQ